MSRAPDSLTEFVRNVVEPMGYELVGVEYLSGGPVGSTLRVFIDVEGGVMLDDCARVSHQVSGVLDVEDPIRENYTLEVSSPGLNRPLFTLKQFECFVGQRVKITMHQKLSGRRRFVGLLLDVQGRDVLLEVDGEAYTLPVDLIEKARLVPEI
ncbi:MAG: ribosome maturation factor RimP [Candidatus Sedimenticola endophacoides]